uniref:Uncharacterized protein n=1 Tax=Candidatus Kentrum sp. UNK TaxID=2126344 RepID=A0A450ZZE2_9GAMM|nr:MAG: hypothetical protein BECKUNK1418G_GA0071005_100654 [Candidatus Kentron sp. UNK]VFK69053.1 MAG: hypothetical protein BECKUNK1418H_GA0071006_100946 [Candidatus Kentron sp. UNK]
MLRIRICFSCISASRQNQNGVSLCANIDFLCIANHKVLFDSGLAGVRLGWMRPSALSTLQLRDPDTNFTLPVSNHA